MEEKIRRNSAHPASEQAERASDPVPQPNVAPRVLGWNWKRCVGVVHATVTREAFLAFRSRPPWTPRRSATDRPSNPLDGDGELQGGRSPRPL